MGIFSDLFGTRAKDSAENYARNAGLQNFNFSGPGGMSVGFTPTSGNVALGALDPIRAMLLGVAGNQFQAGSGTGALTDAAGAADAAISANGLDPAFMTMLKSLIGGQVGTGAAPNFGATGLDPSLLAGITGAAGSNLARAGADPTAIAADRLATLRAQAQPYEQDFIRKNIGDLFAKGRFGSADSLSGKVSEGVARSLSTADLDRQIAAGDFASTQQRDAVSAALGLTGTADNLLGNQFARALSGFQAGQSGMNDETSRILSLLSGATGVANSGAQNALSRFGIAQQLFDSTQAGETNSINRGLGALSGVQGIDSAGLQQFMAALQAATARSNAAGNQANIMNQIAANNPMLDFATGLTGAIMPM